MVEPSVLTDRGMALVRFEAAKMALAEARSIDEVKLVRDQAEALRLYVRQQGESLEMQNDIAEIKLRAERRAGELLAEVQRNLTGRLLVSRKTSQAEKSFVKQVMELDIPLCTVYRWQAEASVPEEQFEEHIAKVRAAKDDLTSVGLYRLARANQSQESSGWWQSSKDDDWWTPQWLFDLLDSEIGFDTDVCASEANHKCPQYYTRQDDGLSQDWLGKCWMNPPYGHTDGVGIYKWLEKAYASASRGATVACLIPARTDTAWWWNFCRYGDIRFLKGRLRFANASNSAPFPSAIVIFWPFVPDNQGKVTWWDVAEEEMADEA